MSGLVQWKGRRNTLEYRAWTKWLEASDRLVRRFCEALEEDDPFSYNETASVSILAAAAACAGYVGLAEFGTRKASGERRSHRHGRNDFWMQAEGRSWAFEFKQWSPTTAPGKRLISHMAAAEKCAKAILRADADAAVAGVIVPLYWIEESTRQPRDEVLQRARSNLADFAEDCDFAWTVGGANGAPETWILFRVVRRWD